MKTINLFFDFKFTSLSPDAQPISLGIVADVRDIRDYTTLTRPEKPGTPIRGIDNSLSFYAEFSDFDIDRCDDWVKENVVSKLKYYNIPDNKEGFSHNLNCISILGNTENSKKALKEWLSQFSDCQIQFVCDCGTFDLYWMLQLLAEWEVKEAGGWKVNLHRLSKSSSVDIEQYIPKVKTGLPKLPDNISPVPFDLNDLIAIRKDITPREAFDIERLGTFCVDNDELYNNVPNTHNALFDARVIKETYNKLK